MPTEIKYRRGTTGEHSAFVGADGEITVDTTKKTVVVHDGVTPGGFPLAKFDELSSGGIGGGNVTPLEQTATDGQTVFTVPAYTTIKVWINGIKQGEGSFTETSSTSITFTEPLEEGDNVLTESTTTTTTPEPEPGTFAASVTQAPANNASVTGVITLRIEGSGIRNAELLPGSSSVYTPIYGTFTIGSDYTWAELAFNTNTLSEGAHTFRIAAYDKAPGEIGATEITAMASRTWNVVGESGIPPGEYPAISGPNPALFTAEPTFYDGFDGSELDQTYWNKGAFYEDGVPANTMRVTNSRLDMCAQTDSMTYTGSNTSYVSVDTDPNSGVSVGNKATTGFSQKFGLFQARCKLPAGAGYWPSFWLFNHVSNHRPEIDIFEAYAGGAGDWSSSHTAPHPMRADVTVHPLDDPGGYAFPPTNFSISEGVDLSAAMHDYTCVWHANYMDFYFDGVFVQRIDDPDVMAWFAQFELYILFSFGLGSAAGDRSTDTNISPVGFGDNPANPKESVFSVEYVMAHQFL